MFIEKSRLIFGLSFQFSITIQFFKVIGTKERKQRELEQRKLFIIEKSKELFFSKGFSNVTIKDICNAIEYGRSAVYNLFASKDEIYGYVYIEAMKLLADAVSEIDVKNSDPRNTLELATQKIYKFYANFTNHYKALFFFDSNRIDCHTLPQEIIEAKHKEKERAILPVFQLLTQGMNDGTLKEMNAHEVIDMYFASLQGIINSFISCKNDSDQNKLSILMRNHAMIYDRGLLNTATH